MKRLIVSVMLVGLMNVVGCSSRDAGSPATALPEDYLAGATWTYSMDGGETWTDEPPFLETDGQIADVISRTTFEVDDVDNLAEVHLDAYLYRPESWATINGTPIQGAYPEMIYPVIRGIDPAILKVGENELRITRTWAKYGDEKEQVPPTSARLVPLAASDLAFRTGPVLGAFDEEQFSITCRTNMVAKVLCFARPVDGGDTITIASSYGLLHEFVVPREGNYEYMLEAKLDDALCKTDWLDAPDWNDVTDGSMRFVVCADSQSENPAWGKLVEMMIAQEPDMFIMCGDMVSNGLDDAQWEAHFFDSARELVAETPLYPVEGNHEMETPILDDLFYTPAERGRGLTWEQQIGDVQFIAINGLEDYSAGSENYAWVEQVLEESDAKFVFLLSHYPAWASGQPASLEPQSDHTAYQARFALMPLLARYDGTAMVAGHWHVYERSEPTEGVTSIVCGGGGGWLEKLAEGDPGNNPHVQGYAEEHHYLVFDVEGDTCTMQTISVDGEVLDTRTWEAREVTAETE